MKLAIILILIAPLFLQAAERITTSSIADVRTLAQKQKAEHGSDSVLVVFDFDSTLMSMNSDLASDPWYVWQSEALKSGNKKEALFKDRSELFGVVYKLTALIDMHAVEAETVKVVRDIQDMNLKTFVQTSRGTDLRSDTQLELDRIDLNFRKSSIGPEGGYAGAFIPEGFEKDRPVGFVNGVFLGSGQNKGKLLRYLLKRTGHSFKSIIFVDDSLKNIEDLENEFQADGILTPVYYTHEHPRFKKFEADKSNAKKLWKKMKPALEAAAKAADYKKIEK